MDIKIHSSDLDVLIQRMPFAPQIIEEEVKLAMMQSVVHLNGKVKEAAPIGASGNLARSIHHYTEGKGANLTGAVEAGPTGFYNYWVNQGTAGPRKMPPYEPILRWVRRVLMVADEKTAKRITWAVRWKIKREGTKANPFLERTANEEQGRVDNFFSSGLARAVGKIGK